jgi:hypothetical protein
MIDKKPTKEHVKSESREAEISLNDDAIMMMMIMTRVISIMSLPLTK